MAVLLAHDIGVTRCSRVYLRVAYSIDCTRLGAKVTFATISMLKAMFVDRRTTSTGAKLQQKKLVCQSIS